MKNFIEQLSIKFGIFA